MTDDSKNKVNLLKKIENYIEEQVINNDNLSDDQKVQKVIVYSSCFCAIVALQPFPIADIFLISPIQLIMAGFISKIRNKIDQKNQKVISAIKELFEDAKWIILGGLFAQHSIIALYKIGLPFLGGFMTIPLVFGFTYSIGKVFDFYVKTLKQKNWNESVEEGKKILDRNKEDLKKIYKKSKAETKQMWTKLQKESVKVEIKTIFKDKNLNHWEKIKKSVEVLVNKISKLLN